MAKGNIHLKIGFILVVLGTIGLILFKFLWPMFEDSRQAQTSDAVATKGTIHIGMDNWIGYVPLCSTELRKRLRRDGYVLECIDDKADYAERMKLLRKGKLEFAVATIDSYLLNAYQQNYPGTIVSIIDESKGGDAIVAWSDKVANIQALKNQGTYRLTFTENSPSAHLLKSVAVHFDIPHLRGKNLDFIPAEGSEDALKKLLNKEADVAVLWEPDVTKAISKTGIKKLLGTEQTEKLIVDILIVNRDFAADKPEVVETLLKHYFRVLKHFQDNPGELINEAADAADVSRKSVNTLIKGVQWMDLTDNALQWFGVSTQGMGSTEELVDTIESVARILVENGDFNTSPVPGNDPYRLTNSRFVKDLFERFYATAQFGQKSTVTTAVDTDTLKRDFETLAPAGWDQLQEIGTLRVRPIVFQSGTSTLTLEGKEQVDRIIENVKHYPHFRILVKGHTSTRGDAAANRRLSQDRAESVQRYLYVTYGIDPDRVRAIGYGGSKPLARQAGESFRAYQYRLPRVEIALVAEKL